MTPYDLLRARCNELLPDHTSKCVRCEKIVPIKSDFCSDGLAHIIEHRPLTITDVLMVLTVSSPSILWSARPYYPNSMQIEVEGKLISVFNLAAPLSDPSNAAACEAVLKLLDSKKV